MRLALAIPVYNEALDFPSFCLELTAQLQAFSKVAVDLWVVDDGSRSEDRVAHQAAVETARAELRGSLHQIHWHPNEHNLGKAASIRRAWEAAASDCDWWGFVDSDGAISASEVIRVLESLDARKVDALCASRVRMAGHRVDRSGLRHLQGRVFATLAEWVLGLGFYDLQCGFKLFRSSLLRPRLGQLQERSWMLDAEVLYLLKRQGARILEIPIDWTDAGHSKVRFAVDAAKMAAQLLRLKRRVDALSP